MKLLLALVLVAAATLGGLSLWVGPGPAAVGAAEERATSAPLAQELARRRTVPLDAPPAAPPAQVELVQLPAAPEAPARTPVELGPACYEGPHAQGWLVVTVVDAARRRCPGVVVEVCNASEGNFGHSFRARFVSDERGQVRTGIPAGVALQAREYWDAEAHPGAEAPAWETLTAARTGGSTHFELRRRE